ncbi:MAG: transcriptional repressor [Anaerolineaceae bacterium]|nr:transcriptional repressor [Anaerolineaceae bacterium]MBN2677339.1 transcriptional repressor [Anaerolineaceae bacterium]
MSCIPELTKKLRARGYRITPQRLVILQALHEGGHLSPLQIYDRVHETGISEPTVYRTLDFLYSNGIVSIATRGNGHMTYELSGDSHHHIICRSCGDQLEIASQLLEPAISLIERETGYQLIASHLTFLGLCPKCNSISK